MLHQHKRLKPGSSTVFSASTEGIFNLFLLTNMDQSRTESTFTTARATTVIGERLVPV